MNTDDFGRRLESMRGQVERLRGTSDAGSVAVEELLVAVEELRVAEEELRQRNEDLVVAHAEMAEERRRYQHLFQYAPDAYLLTDLSGIIREANHSAAHLLGVEPRFLVGKTLVSFVEPGDRPTLRNEIGRWRSEPAAKHLDLRLQPRGGDTFDASLTLSVARGGPRDQAFGVRWLVRDISAHRQLTEELRLREEEARREAEASEARAYHVQKLESVGVLAGGIAHDFNNLLHVILCNADLARLQVGPGSPAWEHLDEVVRATQRAAELTQQLLAYSGRGVVETRQLDLSLEVREMGTLLRTAMSKQASLTWDLAEDLPVVSADPTQIRQVVMNLITNASDALGDGPGTITLRTGEVDRTDPSDGRSMVFLEVTDTGCGMDSGTLQRIFDPFFSTKFTGRGLGLAAVMGIVESHHGRVRIRTSPGEGTTFQVVLPTVTRAADVLAPRRVSGVGWRGRGTVLVVEDEEGVREVVARMLERLGFQVLTAVDGVDAVRVLEHHHGEITTALLDLSMPRMGGQETLSRLRQRSPDLPVILMSGYTEHEMATRILEEAGGGVVFLQKPFLPDDLSSVLRHVSLPANA